MATYMKKLQAEMRLPCADAGPESPLCPSLADTLIVAAREDSFQEVFIGQRCWYPVRLDSNRRAAIKWIAPYQGKPVSAITCFARIEKIEAYLATGRHKIYFSEPVKLDRPVIANPATHQGIQGQRYTVLRKLLSAQVLADLKPWD